MPYARFVSLAALSLVSTVACLEVDQPLGDAPAAGTLGSVATGGSGGGSGGTGGGTGGTGTTGGSGGSGTAGTGGRLPMPGGAGTTGTGGATANGGFGNDTGEAGETNEAGVGGGTSPCFSPSNPAGALHGERGCVCGAADEDQCLRVVDGTRAHLVALSCIGGEWTSVEDGACDVGQGCVVGGRLYPADEGAGFPSPFDTCNHCGCNAGGLSCTEIGCEHVTCPNGTVLGIRCLGCGPVDECPIQEYGCIPACESDAQCETGMSCYDGRCTSLCG